MSGGPAAFVTALASLKVELHEWRLDRDVDAVVGILKQENQSSKRQV